MQFILFLFALMAALASLYAQELQEGLVCPQEQPDDSLVIQLPSPTSCSVFYKCDRGVARLNKCPPGLHYNQRLKTCDYPYRAGCTLEN